MEEYLSKTSGGRNIKILIKMTAHALLILFLGTLLTGLHSSVVEEVLRMTVAIKMHKQ